jgi:iron complex outermembrane recepter protein
VVSPTVPEERFTDRPLRIYGTGAFSLTERVTVYAGYGVAASSAENRGAILPDARTWQADAGIRYLPTPRMKLIAGIFEIGKPYFNLDTSNVERALGLQRAPGMESSASGEVVKNFEHCGRSP